MKPLYKNLKQNACLKLNTRYRRGGLSNQNQYTDADYRAMYQGEIESHKRSISTLEEKLRQLDVMAADAKRISTPQDKYQGWTLTPAILDAVKSLNQGAVNSDGVEAYDVLLHLSKHGFTMTPNTSISVHITLGRLADSGRMLLKRDKFHKKFYKPIK